MSRNKITLDGMEILGGWGLANTALGVTGWALSQGGQNRYFYQMTAIWGAINFVVAIPGYLNAKRNLSEAYDRGQTFREQQKIEKIFLVNGLLDVGYIGAGFYLNSRGIDNGNTQLKGYGLSIALQGSFLLLFDATMYRAHKGNGNKLMRFLQNHPIAFNGKSLGIQVNI